MSDDDLIERLRRADPELTEVERRRAVKADQKRHPDHYDPLGRKIGRHQTLAELRESCRIQPIEAFEVDVLAMMRRGFVTRFAADQWADNFLPDDTPYSYLIRKILPEQEATLIYGAPQTGKSFLAQMMALAVARGTTFLGYQTRPAGVIYCAFEGGRNFRNRQRAYAIHQGLGPESDVPMVSLRARADLFGGDTDWNALLVELQHWSDVLPIPLGLIVIDTFSAVTPGLDESSAKDHSRMRQRIMSLIGRFKAAVLVVHHKAKGGTTPRGHGSLIGDFETNIDVDWAGEERDEHGRGILKDGYRDADGNHRGRIIRRMSLTKQREGLDGIAIDFVLQQIRLGTIDDFDEEETSCAVVEPTPRTDEDLAELKAKAKSRPKGLTQRAKIALRCLADALTEAGIKPDPAMRLPASITTIVEHTYWRKKVLAKLATEEEPIEKTRSMMRRLNDELLEKGRIGRENPYVWII